MKNRTAVWIVVVLILLVGAYLYFTRTKNATDTIVADQVACTMEAKLCPDGSSVGRSGPDCAFAACPTPVVVTPAVTPATTAEGAYPADIYK
jgi:hypothetical protein